MSDDPHRLGDALSFAEHPAQATPPDAWQSLAFRMDDATLRARVTRVLATFTARTGAPVEARVAASTEHFGVVARLVSAHICGRAVGRPVDLRATHVWCREVPGRLLQLSCARQAEPSDPLEHTAIRDVTDTVERLYAVSPQVLWGNIGSAANSTVNLLRASRPDLVDAATVAADEILHDPRVDGGVLQSGPTFRRHSCCLIYRATGGVCGDCVLRR